MQGLHSTNENTWCKQRGNSCAMSCTARGATCKVRERTGLPHSLWGQTSRATHGHSDPRADGGGTPGITV